MTRADGNPDGIPDAADAVITDEPVPEDYVPAVRPRNCLYSRTDILAIVSMFCFAMVPALLALYTVGDLFHLGEYSRGGPRHHMSPFPALLPALTAMVLAMFAGHYVWLFSMRRFLTRASIGPLLAWGVPRRISRLDRALVLRLYRSPGPVLKSQSGPSGYHDLRLALRTLVVLYSAMAMIAVELSCRHIGHRHAHLVRSAAGWGTVSVILFLLDVWVRRSRRP